MRGVIDRNTRTFVLALVVDHTGHARTTVGEKQLLTRI